MSAPATSLDGNPIRDARFKLKKTIKRCATEAGVHEQAWYLTECGCYNRVPPAIRKYFSMRHIPIDYAEYDHFRYNKQVEFGQVYLQDYYLPPVDIRVPPVGAFIDCNDLPSSSNFAKSLCINTGSLYKLLLGTAKEIPKQIQNALLNAGVDADDVEELNERTIEYYEAHVPYR